MLAEYCEGALRAGASYCLIRVMGFIKLQWAPLLDHQGFLLRKVHLGRVESCIVCRVSLA